MVLEVFSKLIDSLIVYFCLNFHGKGVVVCLDEPGAVLCDMYELLLCLLIRW